MKTLTYPSKWFDYGFLTQADLRAQQLSMANGEDPHPEHHRYKILLRWLQQRETFTDIEIEQFLELVTADEDQVMAGAALSDLFRSGKLTIQQHLKVKLAFLTYGEWAQKVVRRVEDPEQQSFNQAFCQQLELHLNRFLSESESEELTGFWCDGVAPCFVLPLVLRQEKCIQSHAFLGEDGQGRFDINIRLGPKALQLFWTRQDMAKSIPESALETWIRIDLQTECVAITLE
ncbi:MAG: hypothetical protein AAFV95_20735 [Bacteroidota bacterium]